MPGPRLALLAALAITVSALSVACNGGGAGAACADEVRERLDPNSAQHLLPGADPPRYTTHPPTSGAHPLGSWPTGVLDAPVDERIQVGLLEAGEVLLQHEGIDEPDRDELEKLARLPQVTIAPGTDLPAPIVATAWTYKQTCEAVDVDALRGFVRAHAGKGA